MPSDNIVVGSFLAENNIASICCTISLQPYCFNCFYAFMEVEMLLVFKSAESTLHSDMLKQNNLIAGTILSQENTLLINQGAQFQGEVLRVNNMLDTATAHYYRKYPFAVAITGAVFILKLTRITVTQSAYGKRAKHTWKRQ